MRFVTDPVGRLAVGAVDFLVLAGAALAFLEGTVQLFVLAFAPVSAVATVVVLQHVAGRARQAEDGGSTAHTGPER